ncbi:uncharacterized protein LOC131613591 [Vicia villosa]|uniref:uncharacterized protein LOC131613591 n=1 Tax=Vicia villosa TaxID=3911 RepID=UPI00273A77FA|nr:uncharacterized protein LOC131613591 [Vicia villosa]
MKWLLSRSGVYWTSILKDCIEFAKGIQECQMHGGIQHVPTSELDAIVKPWPFKGWAMDVIGEIKPASSKQKRYILAGIDYFTKWVKVVALTNVDQEVVIDFIQNHIMCRFGIPKIIATEVGVKLLTSTLYYAQENGQVEAANKVIISLIKKHVGKKPRNWHKTLDQALWALLLVEIDVQSLRIQRQHEIPSEDYWNMMADELVDLDEKRMLALDSIRRQKERVARAYNKKVKDKVFVVDDLVWKVILPMYRNERVLGKWSPNWEGPFKVIQVFSNNAYELEELVPDRWILRVNGKYLKKYKPILQEVKISTE